MTDDALLRRVEWVLLRPDARRQEVEQACDEALRRGCLALGVGGSWVELAAAKLEGSVVKVSALVGFPFGTADADVKRYEAEAAVDAGAQEIEVVLHPGWLRDGDHRSVLRSLRDIREAAEERPLKVVVEWALVPWEGVVLAGELVRAAEAQFLVTGTGCAGRATTPEDLLRLREVLGPELGIKAVGGIQGPSEVEALVQAGANRVGVFDLTAYEAFRVGG